MSSRSKVPVVGAFTGAVHGFTTRVLTDGRSLHPDQRAGLVAHTYWPSLPAARLPGLGSAPPAGAPDISYPHILSPSITTATNPATRV